MSIWSVRKRVVAVTIPVAKKKYSKSVQLQIYPNTPEVNQRLEVSKPDQILRWILVEVERRAEPQPIISFQLGMLR